MIKCLSFFLVPFRSSNTPFYPWIATSQGACPDSLFFRYFHFILTFESIKELGKVLVPQLLTLPLFSPHIHIWIYQGAWERVIRLHYIDCSSCQTINNYWNIGHSSQSNQIIIPYNNVHVDQQHSTFFNNLLLDRQWFMCKPFHYLSLLGEISINVKI